METWYTFSWSGTEIREVEVISSTEKTLLVKPITEVSKPRRVRIESAYQKFFPSMAEAVNYQKERLENKLAYAIGSLARARQQLETFMERYKEYADTDSG